MEFTSVLPTSILISTVAMLKMWIEVVNGARSAGLTIRAKAIQLWEVGAGLPLDALKKGTIVECVPYRDPHVIIAAYTVPHYTYTCARTHIYISLAWPRAPVRAVHYAQVGMPLPPRGAREAAVARRPLPQLVPRAPRSHALRAHVVGTHREWRAAPAADVAVVRAALGPSHARHLGQDGVRHPGVQAA